jgi:signal transduction histidine kinase
MDAWLDTFARANFQRSADTAHDLKTPLNVAVLNLELLRMRVRKLAGGADDEKIDAYLQAIETELRRMGRIFDAFFLLSTPPKDDEAPVMVDVAPILAEAAPLAGLRAPDGGPFIVRAHEPRIRLAFRMLFEGASRLFRDEDRHLSTRRDVSSFSVLLAGSPVSADVEVPKLFKFYYTDPQGNPDLSLAIARLIAETYGGELGVTEERDKVSLRLSLPQGAR